MRAPIPAFLLFYLAACVSDAPQLHALNVVSGFHHPESVLFDETNGVWYVSNVGEQGVPNDGFISRLDRDGTIEELRLFEGLDDPKGMALVDSTLFVADLQSLVALPLRGELSPMRIPVQGAVFLNDVVADLARGELYVSDSFTDTIFRMDAEGARPFLRDASLEGPNGLLLQDGTLFVATLGPGLDPATFGTDEPGRLLAVDLETRAVRSTSERFGALDGLVPVGGGALVSDTFAGVYFLPEGGAPELLASAEEHAFAGAADLGFDGERAVLAVPQLFGEAISFFRFE